MRIKKKVTLDQMKLLLPRTCIFVFFFLLLLLTPLNTSRQGKGGVGVGGGRRKENYAGGTLPGSLWHGI